MHLMGFQKTLVDPSVKVAYTYEYYYKNHYLYPWTKNLFTYFYYYFKYGFIIAYRGMYCHGDWGNKSEYADKYCVKN